MIIYDLFRTVDGTLHRVDTSLSIFNKAETLGVYDWYQNKYLPAAWFYDGKLNVTLVARNVVFKGRLC